MSFFYNCNYTQACGQIMCSLMFILIKRYLKIHTEEPHIFETFWFISIFESFKKLLKRYPLICELESSIKKSCSAFYFIYLFIYKKRYEMVHYPRYEKSPVLRCIVVWHVGLVLPNDQCSQHDASFHQLFLDKTNNHTSRFEREWGREVGRCGGEIIG